MTDRSEKELFDAMLTGDEAAFERVYDRYNQVVRVIAWRISHRADWVDDILNETWCRAFRQRTSYKPAYRFQVWMSGILQNVYREHCRKSPLTFDAGDEAEATGQLGIDERRPDDFVEEAELLLGLNDCVARLSSQDAKIIDLRFFQEMTLRSVAKELRIPESTLREVRLPAAYEDLRSCLGKKGMRILDLFPAQTPGKMQ